jgi:hypothetical protein
VITATTSPATVAIRICAREYDKPYDPACPVCISPVLLQVDTLLSYGWTYERVRDYMGSMRPAGVRVASAKALHAHVAHLAAPHAEARRQLEEDVSARGASMDGGSSPVSAADLTRLTLQKAYQNLQDGGSEASVRDAATMLKLIRDLERDDQARQLQGSIEQWQAAMTELLWIARKHLGTHWAAFAADVRSSETLKAIMPRREEAADDAEPASAD